ncbi:MAG: acetyl-CoA carboxylase biotin carboxyl carrier protein subunit [Bacteroidales bacterium]|nr:acetyl-CoA carboxylase biotin carboxyl carrier protein subunit [Bacteroidales bacterium]
MKKYKFSIKGTDYQAEILKYEGNQLDIDINGTVYNVEIEREQKAIKTPTIVRRDTAPEPPKPLKSNAAMKKVIAPLPGNILKIAIKEGDAIKRGGLILVMEAMKMENNILAEEDGIVTSIKVKEGGTVLQGDVLAEME